MAIPDLRVNSKVDIGGAVNTFLSIRDQKLREEDNKRQAQLLATAPQRAKDKAVLQAAEQDEKTRAIEFIAFGDGLKSLPIESQDELLRQRVTKLQSEGRDTTNTLQLLANDQQGRDRLGQMARDIAREQGIIKPLQTGVVDSVGPDGRVQQNLINKQTGGVVGGLGESPVNVGNQLNREKFENSKLQKAEDERVGRAEFEQTATAKRISEDRKLSADAKENIFKRAGKFRGEAKPVIAERRAGQKAFGNLQTSLALKTGVGDLVAIIGLNKIIDPGSVVKSEEVKVIQDAKPIIDNLSKAGISGGKAEGWFNTLFNGEKLNTVQRKEIAEVAEKMNTLQNKTFDKYKNRITNQAKRFGIERADIFAEDDSVESEVAQPNERDELLSRMSPEQRAEFGL